MADEAGSRRASYGGIVAGTVDTSKDPKDPRDQLEMFIFKFPDLDRDELSGSLSEFQKFDIDKTDELDEGQAMQLLEARGEVHTFLELRREFEAMDADKNRKINFLEFATYAYKKSWVELHTWADAAQYEAAMKAVAAAAAKRDAAEAAIQAVKEREEKKAAERAAELEAEAKLTGVAGMAAFFKRQAESTQDETKTNEQIIKEQAALRKQKREAKKAQAEAARLAEEAKKGDPEEAKRKIEEQKAEAEAKAKAEADAKKAEERARRQAFKEKMNAKWNKQSGKD